MVFNGAQFHLLVNHLPVIGFLGMVLALAFAMITKSLDIKRFVLIATAIVGLSALAPYFTGEEAEEVIEHLPGVSKDLIHEHEELAEKATILAVLTALAAAFAFGLHFKRPDSLKASIPAVFLLSLVTSGLMGAAAHEGGKIRHPEINPTSEELGASGAAPGVDED